MRIKLPVFLAATLLSTAVSAATFSLIDTTTGQETLFDVTGTDTNLVTGTAGSTNECVKWDGNGDVVTTGATCAIPGGPVTQDVTQVSHGFSVCDVVSYAPSPDNAWILATRGDANKLANGIVSAVAGGNDFTVVTEGYLSGCTGLTQYADLYLSSTAGEIIAVKSTTGIRQRIGKALSATELLVNIGVPDDSAQLQQWHTFYLVAVDTDPASADGYDWIAPTSGRIFDAAGFCQTNGVASTTTMDVEDGGTTIFSSKITIDAGERSTNTAATPPSLTSSPHVFSSGDIFTVEVETAPSSGCAGAALQLLIAWDE